MKRKKPDYREVFATAVSEQLRNCANIYEERNKVYGDNYKHFGKIMVGLFPNGLTLETEDDFNRIGVFVQAVSKITRYAKKFSSGGHADSLDDLSVYSQMLRELDAEASKSAMTHNNSED